jgi:hypothetical protein
MKYVVVKPYKNISKVYILEEGVELSTPFETWALANSRQILFANTRMRKVLNSQYIGGTYEIGALYSYSYEEMCAIISSNLGPSDRERYEAAEAGVTNGAPSNPKNHDTSIDRIDGWLRVGYILWKTFVLCIKVSIKAFNTVIFLVILPLIIKWFNGFNK